MEKKDKKNKIKTLKDYKSSLRSWNIFPQAIGKLPKFLQQNLIDDARTIKIFLDDNVAYIKIFYFQFLKLCFQTEDIDYQTKINKFIDTIQKNVQLLTISSKYKYYEQSSEVIKNILFQFLELISQCTQPVENTLSKYPVIGDIITNFLRQYLNKYQNITGQDYNTNQVIQKLSQYFMVDIIQYDHCIQFTDSQIYVYTKNSKQLYMVYIDQSKAERGIKVENPPETNPSNKSSQGHQYEVISFQAPDIVFQSNDVNKNFKQSKIKICLQDASTRQTFTKTPTVFKQSNKQNIHEEKQLKYQIKTLFKQSGQNKSSSQLNITKQFTNTFILDTLIVQPYRSKIKEIKAKARNQRKSKKPFFV